MPTVRPQRTPRDALRAIATGRQQHRRSTLLIQVQKAQGNPVSAKELYEQIWQSPYDASAANTVMVHIRHLRKKLAAIDSSEQFIKTAWGIGYQIKQGSQSL